MTAAELVFGDDKCAQPAWDEYISPRLNLDLDHIHYFKIFINLIVIQIKCMCSDINKKFAFK